MRRSADTLSSTSRSQWAARCLVAVAVWSLLLVGPARGDAFRVLPDNREAIQARIDLIQQAQHEIIVVYYAMDTGLVSSSVMALLRDAAGRGVRVRVLVDGLQSRVPSELECYLASAGIEIRCYHPPRVLHPVWLNRRLHDKLLIADAEQLIVGSRNLKDEHFGLDVVNYVDCDAYIRGQTAAHATRYFEWLWQTPDVQPVRPADSLGYDVLNILPRGKDLRASVWRNARTPQDYGRLLDRSLATLVSEHGLRLHTGHDWSAAVAHDVPVVLRHDSDTRKSELAIQEAVVRLIDSAEHSLWIETPYPVFTHVTLEAILAARQRGVRVVLVTGSLSSTDRLTTYSAFQNLKCLLRRSGVQIWEYVGCDHLHSKSMVIDDCTAVIGSYNFDPRSEYSNLEVIVAARDRTAAAALKETIRRQMASAVEVEDCRATAMPNGGMQPSAFTARWLKMQLVRLVVPAFRRLL